MTRLTDRDDQPHCRRAEERCAVDHRGRTVRRKVCPTEVVKPKVNDEREYISRHARGPDRNSEHVQRVSSTNSHPGSLP